ncbi:MAG: hypothetical protein ABJL67_24975, partial [Sulfitobacter sp.]
MRIVQHGLSELVFRSTYPFAEGQISHTIDLRGTHVPNKGRMTPNLSQGPSVHIEEQLALHDYFLKRY